LAKNWPTVRNIIFCFPTHLLFSARRYKFGDINNNELLIINLAAVRADGNANASSSPSPERKPKQMNQPLETKVIQKYVAKDKQSRYIQFVSSEKNRDKFISELPHFTHFKWELLEEVHKEEAQEIQKRLKVLNIKRTDCYVISENPDIDQKTLSFDEALAAIGGMATLLVFGDVDMIYFEGEPPKNRFISKVR
jgi:hypothetical protein